MEVFSSPPLVGGDRGEGEELNVGQGFSPAVLFLCARKDATLKGCPTKDNAGRYSYFLRGGK